MNLHEYQAKALLAQYQIPTPINRVAASVDQAREAATELGGESWMVKAQIHAGGRGKAGGVRKATGIAQLTQAATELLGKRLVTHQSGPQGQPVERLLIETPCAIARELYLAALLDRPLARIAVIAAAEGGMDIEELAAREPHKIRKIVAHPVAGIQPYQCRELAFALGLKDKQVSQLGDIITRLFHLYKARDLSLIEINPLVVTTAGELLALDAKIQADDNALFRQAALASSSDAGQEEERERRAREHDLNYVALHGNIACMVNGAGLAMATMDLIKLHGGEPANFLDVGGGTTAERVAEAFKLILADPKVRAILVNIFGGIVRCDLIADGIIRAVREVGIKLPVVVRLEGTNAEQGRALLNDSGLKIIAATGLTDAAQRAVAAASVA